MRKAEKPSKFGSEARLTRVQELKQAQFFQFSTLQKSVETKCFELFKTCLMGLILINPASTLVASTLLTA